MIVASRLRSFVGHAGLLVTGLLVAALVAEGVIRIVAPQRLESHRPIYVADSLLVYRLKQNYDAEYHQPEFSIHEQTNELGLRNGPVGPKRAGVMRILGLGDSFCYSNSVQLGETFFKQLEELERRRGGNEVEVINAAVPAYSTVQEYRYLLRDGMKLGPDLVVLGFYVGNDFQDSYELFDSSGLPTVDVVGGELRANDRFPAARYERQERVLRTATLPLRSFLASNSELYVFLRERFGEALWKTGLRNNPPPPDFCARVPSAAMEAGWAMTRSVLDSMAALCSAHNARLLIVALPTQYQVHPDLWTHHFTTFGLDPADYDLDQPQRLLREFCEQKGIDHVDVLPAMRAHAPSGHLFYPIASYMTPSGHRLVADVVHAHLQASPRAGIANRERQ